MPLSLVILFSNFLFRDFFLIKMSLFFQIFFLYLMCSCPYPCNHHGNSSLHVPTFYQRIVSTLECMVLVFNATFNNISVVSWRSVLLVEEIAVKNIYCVCIYHICGPFIVKKQMSYLVDKTNENQGKMLTYTMLSGEKNLNDNIHSYNILLYSTSYID